MTDKSLTPKPPTLAEHGTWYRAAICDCPPCTEIRERKYQQQREWRARLTADRRRRS